MRIRIPNDISLIGDLIAPYMVKNAEGTALVLKDGAPEEVVVAKMKYDDWWATHHSQP